MNSLTETKEFDKLKIMKTAYKDSPRRLSTHIKHLQNRWIQLLPRQCTAYGKKCTDCSKINHFREVCRSRRARAMNDVEQETVQVSTEESSIDSENINSIHFKKKPLGNSNKLKKPCQTKIV